MLELLREARTEFSLSDIGALAKAVHTSGPLRILEAAILDDLLLVGGVDERAQAVAAGQLHVGRTAADTTSKASAHVEPSVG